MTLKEAIESGYRFKRKGEKYWSVRYDVADDGPYFSYEDVVATDYILKEDPPEPKYLWAILGTATSKWRLFHYTETRLKELGYVIGKTAIKLGKVGGVDNENQSR